MSSSPIQKGVTLKIGFGSFAYVGNVPESVSVENPAGNEEIILDENGATLTKIIMDPRTILRMTVVILDD